MTRTRQAVEDAINGDKETVDQAALRALRVIASDVDEMRDVIATATNRFTSAVAAVSASVVVAAIVAALRLS